MQLNVSTSLLIVLSETPNSDARFRIVSCLRRHSSSIICRRLSDVPTCSLPSFPAPILKVNSDSLCPGCVCKFQRRYKALKTKKNPANIQPKPFRVLQIRQVPLDFQTSSTYLFGIFTFIVSSRLSSETDTVTATPVFEYRITSALPHLGQFPSITDSGEPRNRFLPQIGQLALYLYSACIPSQTPLPIIF